MRNLQNYRLATADEILNGAYVPVGKAFMVTQIDPETPWRELFGALAFLVETEKPKPEPATQEPKKTGPAAVKLAYDKIMEMRDAGNTYDEIGAHFGCTGQTIRNFLAREGKAKSQKGE